MMYGKKPAKGKSMATSKKAMPKKDSKKMGAEGPKKSTPRTWKLMKAK